jgi:hypothetical protein
MQIHNLNYYTEIEIPYEHYSLFVECEVIYNETDCNETHPYGDGYATEYYTEREVEDVNILSYYKEFNIPQELELYVPDHCKKYEGSLGLSKEERAKAQRLAECKFEESL